MPKDKDRSVNPAAAQRKLDKQKDLKRGKAEALTRRNEKLARRNPDRIQRQINDLKELEESGQKLRPREKEILEALGRDLRAVQKAREALGDKAPQFHNHDNAENRRGSGGGRGRGDGVLGKRRRDGHGPQFGQDDDSSGTDDEVRNIPMPRDTPPPIPRQYQKKDAGAHPETQGPHPLPNRPSAVAESKTVYEAQPEIKDLRREAINKFVPAAVRVKQDAIKGQGKLLEPEEMDRLEKAGYQAGPAERGERGESASAGETTLDNEDEEGRRRQLEEEERRFNQELRSVQIEEVEDEDA